MLFGKQGRDDLVIRGAHVLDTAAGVDAVLDVRVDGGTIAQLGTNLETNAHRVVDGQGLVLAPAFVDPHVHLRTPGREDEETIASGTAAAAAGGYCAILAMPNTEPVVDSAAVLGSLAETAQAEAGVPVGFLAAITRNQGRAGGAAAPPLPDGRGGSRARPERKDDPAAESRGGPAGADRRPPRRHDRRRCDRSRPARASRERGAVRGSALRRHRARDRLLRALHASRRARAAEARDAARADVRGAGARVRPGCAADRRRRAREPRPARPEGEQARLRERLPFALGELVAARPDRQGQGAADDRGREGRVRGVIAVAPTYLDAAAEAYRADVVAAIDEEVGVLDSFVLGSGLVGGYRPGESDLDLVVVVDAPLQGEPRRRAIERIAALERPGRRLELAAYVRGRQPPDFDLNLEVDDDGAREAPDELDHWFVIDAGIAQERIRVWTDYFEPVPEERLREAGAASLAWSEERPDPEFPRLNAARARHYLEHGEWLSKQEVKR